MNKFFLLSTIFCLLSLSMENVHALGGEGWFERSDCIPDCENTTRGRLGTCTERKSAEDPKDGKVYDCEPLSGQGGGTGGGTTFPVEGGNNPSSAESACSSNGGFWVVSDGEQGKCVTKNSSGATKNNGDTKTSYPTTSASSAGACEAGFTKVSGVCVPGNTGLPGQSVDVIVKNFLFWLLSIFATIATIAFLISGVQYLVASGDQKIMETAKRNMTYSIIGILIGLSGLIVLRAIEALLGANSII